MTQTDDAIVEYLDPKKHARSWVSSLIFIGVIVVFVMVAMLFLFLPGLGCKLFNWTVTGCRVSVPPLQPPVGTPLRILSCVEGAPKCMQVTQAGGAIPVVNCTNADYLFEIVHADAPPEKALYTMKVACNTDSVEASFVVPQPDSNALTLAMTPADGAWQLRGTLEQCFLRFVSASGPRGALVVTPPLVKGKSSTIKCDPSALYSADAWQLLSLTAPLPDCSSSG